jgi:hypothetical protein
MSRTVAALAIVLIIPILTEGAPRLKAPNNGLPVGQWRVEFANGVVETCKVGDNGEASVVEPLRSSPGKATVREGLVVIAFDDDRIERWKRVGKRWVVEHWYPVSAFPENQPVLGTAEPAK